MPAIASFPSEMVSSVLDASMKAITNVRRGDEKIIPPWSGLPQREVVIYYTVSCISLAVTVSLFYRRCRRLTLKTLRHMTYIRLLVILSYMFAIAFSLTAMSLVAHGITTLNLCRNSIYVCIGFLFAGKMAMQLFLIERMHVSNINYLRRRDDPFWWVSIGALAVAGSAITVWTYINPVYYMSEKDGRCRKGLPPNVVAPIQALEVTLNLVLTAVFVSMLRRSRRCELFPGEPERVFEPANPFRSSISRLKTLCSERDSEKKLASGVTTTVKETRGNSTASNSSDGTTVVASTTTSTFATKEHGAALDRSVSTDLTVVLPASTRPSRLRHLARKSLIGTLLMLAWTITNDVIFYVTRGRENAWLCFIQCNLDVILSVIVLHWLTSDHQDEKHPSAGDTRSSLASMPTFHTSHALAMDTPAAVAYDLEDQGLHHGDEAGAGARGSYFSSDYAHGVSFSSSSARREEEGEDGSAGHEQRDGGKQRQRSRGDSIMQIPWHFALETFGRGGTTGGTGGGDARKNNPPREEEV